MPFSQLGLSEPLLRALRDLKYATPTPIQLQAIPAILAGSDLLAAAQTGTGKTASFVLPILQKLMTVERPAQGRAPRALILVPTRELAAQVHASVNAYGRHLRLRSVAVFGGASMGGQARALRDGVDVVVATPGRLLDHLTQGTARLGSIEMLVLDEADRMLDMGFIRDIRKILSRCPASRQNLLFSATFSESIRSLARELLKNPQTIDVAPRNAPAEQVEQKVHLVDRDRKRDLLVHLIQQHGWRQVLIFARTKHGADRLAEQLLKSGVSAVALHGNKSQSARTRALADFKGGHRAALVATDIAARGIDIHALPQVVNFDLPQVPEDYVHRIGRTGRAGAGGAAISLVSHDEDRLLVPIERLLKRSLPREAVVGFERTRAPAKESRRPPAARRAGKPGVQAAPSHYRGAAPPRGRERDGNRRPGVPGAATHRR